MIRKKVSNTVLFHAVVCAIGFVMIYPLIWMFFSSFKESSLVLSTVDHLFPEKWEFGNYLNGWSGFGGTTFTTFFQNSVIVTVVSVIGNVLASAMAAYGFTRIRFRGRGFFFICMLITMMVPSQVLVVPQYIIFNGLNWVNTFLPLTVPEWGGRAFFIFLIMQFIAGIPKDLDEAAEIDGCGKVRLFTRVMMPLIKPALVTAGIFSFMWRWDDFLSALLYVNKSAKYPVSLALKLFCDPGSSSDYGAMFAMASLSILPSVLIFIFFQRYLVEGISTSGLKG